MCTRLLRLQCLQVFFPRTFVCSKIWNQHFAKFLTFWLRICVKFGNWGVHISKACPYHPIWSSTRSICMTILKMFTFLSELGMCAKFQDYISLKTKIITKTLADTRTWKTNISFIWVKTWRWHFLIIALGQSTSVDIVTWSCLFNKFLHYIKLKANESLCKKLNPRIRTLGEINCAHLKMITKRN